MRSRVMLRRSLLMALATGALLCPAVAHAWSWDPDPALGVQGGAGVWDTSPANTAWHDGSANVAWNNASPQLALFGTAAGVVTLNAPVTAAGLQFNLAGYTLTGTPALTLAQARITTSLANAADLAILDAPVAGSAGLAKYGKGTLRLTAAGNAWTGDTLVHSAGTLALAGNATDGSTSAINVYVGGTLDLDNVSGANLADRVDAPLTLAGGTLRLLGANAGSTESLTSLTLAPGAATVTVTRGSSPTGVTALTLNALTPQAGGTVNFTSGAGTLGATGNSSRLLITGQADGFIGGFATVGNDFAGYSTALDTGLQRGVLTLTGTVNDINAAGPAGHVRRSGAGQTVTASASVASLNILSTSTNQNYTLNPGVLLNLVSGGFLKSGNQAQSFTGGAITVGGTPAGPGTAQLFLHANQNTLTLNSTLLDNLGLDGLPGGAGTNADLSVSLVKTGAGSVVLTADNTFTGDVYLNGGTLQANFGSDAAPLHAIPFGTDLHLAGGTLNLRSDRSLDNPAAALGLVNVLTSAAPTLNVDRQSASGAANLTFRAGAVTVANNAVLNLSAGNMANLRVPSVSGAGTLRFSDSASSKASLLVDGDFTFTGDITWTANTTTNPTVDLVEGLQFFSDTNFSNRILHGGAPSAGSGGSPRVGASGADVRFNGYWLADSGTTKSFLILRDGATWTFGQDAIIDFVPSHVSQFTRQMWVYGDGTPVTVEFEENFKAVRGTDPAEPVIFGSIRLQGAGTTLITHHTDSLPAYTRDLVTPARNGHLVFETAAGSTWWVKTNAQTFDCGTWVAQDTTFRLDADLTLNGFYSKNTGPEDTYEAFNGLYLRTANITLTKTGAATLHLTGHQGYTTGSQLRIEQGAVEFLTNPGDTSFFNSVGGTVPNGRYLTVTVTGSTSNATFGATQTDLVSLHLADNALARVTTLPGGPTGIKVLTTLGLMADAGSTQLHLDLDTQAHVQGPAGLALANNANLRKTGQGVLNLTSVVAWGNAANLRIEGGSAMFDIAAGAVSVAPDAAMHITPGTLAIVGGAVDPFTDALDPTQHVAIINDAVGGTGSEGFQISQGVKHVSSVDGLGSTAIASGAELVTRRIRQSSLRIGGSPPPTAPPAPIPEPGTASLLLAGVLTLLRRRHRTN